jgi:hypothetical protein
MSDSLCANCGTPLAGEFCHLCGQRAGHLHLGFREFFHEAFHELAHFDGKILLTLKTLLFRPGVLTREFIEGRRAQYITPVRLYLVVSAIFFFLAATHGRDTGLIQFGSGPPPKGVTNVGPAMHRTAAGSELSARMERGLKRADADPEWVAEELAHAFGKVMFVLMPIFALIVWLFERRRQRLYIPHLYFGIHYHAFAFALFSVATVMGIPHIRWLTALSKLLILLIFVYLYAALRNAYGDSRAAALLKTIGIASIYGAFVIVAMLVVVFAKIAMTG